MESLYWQMLGWAHTPPFIKADLTCPVRLHAPSLRKRLHPLSFISKKGFDPKVQIGNRVPYGYFSRDIAIDLENDDGIPSEPFLPLELFDDDWYYETRSPQEWLSLGLSDDEKRPVPGTALIPVNPDEEGERILFGMAESGCSGLRSGKETVSCQNETDCSEDGKPPVFETSKSSDLWIPRVNLKFEAEEPLQEESLPKWLHKDLEELIAIARRSRQLRPRLKWIKDELENEKLKNVIEPHRKGHLVKLNYSFKERFESFWCKTLWNQPQAVQALNLVQDEISKVHIMSLFNLSSDDISGLDHFETEQRAQLYKAQKYIHGTWLSTIANSILSTMSKCKMGSYDLNQTVQHTFKLTKIGKLLKLMGFKMQDVTRHMVTESLSQFATIFQDACANLSEVKDKFEWREPFSCNKWIPLRNPIFEVGLELKGTHLEFVVDLHKHRDIVVDLFEEALRVTQGLPRLEKLVMKKLLYKPDDKLESVLNSEPQISNWKKKIVTGINRAIIVSVAYARSYNETLKAFKEDQINYVKKLARAKATCDQLKDIIEMHYSEKERLLDVIPLYIDIGPFRLITEGVRTAAVRKHEQFGRRSSGPLLRQAETKDGNSK
ncbi:dynein heavy chain 1, axonemal [Caerostris extrusa]|uniref:Dynein heavy chain 1, axonemal n=1 Tax=Caerostris extrusa TaxID=172846 RepID=A0AAV4MKT9_CAEEX|nr:dynein heavy chain 1, axonemal [Caerostris extrusa]